MSDPLPSGQCRSALPGPAMGNTRLSRYDGRDRVHRPPLTGVYVFSDKLTAGRTTTTGHCSVLRSSIGGATGSCPLQRCVSSALLTKLSSKTRLSSAAGQASCTGFVWIVVVDGL